MWGEARSLAVQFVSGGEEAFDGVSNTNLMFI